MKEEDGREGDSSFLPVCSVHFEPRERRPGVKSVKFNSENAVSLQDFPPHSFAFYLYPREGKPVGAPDIFLSIKVEQEAIGYHWNCFLNYRDKNCELLLLN